MRPPSFGFGVGSGGYTGELNSVKKPNIWRHPEINHALRLPGLHRVLTYLPTRFEDVLKAEQLLLALAIYREGAVNIY